MIHSKRPLHVQTGSQWCQLKEFENAEACFGKCMPCAASWKALLAEDNGSANGAEEIAEDLFGLFTLRMTAAWQLDMQVGSGHACILTCLLN